MAKAAILEEVGKLTIGEVELAEPLAHEVLIDTKACGLCHSDPISSTAPIRIPRPQSRGMRRRAWYARSAVR
jgi:Zn-dependent alcohol dehydrogenase